MCRLTIIGWVLVIGHSYGAGAEVQVNQRTSGAQANPAIAADRSGGAIIVWSSYYPTAGRSNEILARRLDPNGTFLEDEFQVNVIWEGNQTEPAVAANGQGRFVVAWQGPGPDQEDIFLRLFDEHAAPVSEDLLVNLNPTGRQVYPSVAICDTGTSVVAWESRETTLDGDRTLAKLQLFDPNGAGLGDEFPADDPFYDCRYPAVAMDAAGHFVVTWLRVTGTDTIMARRFDPNGMPRDDPFAVSTTRIASITRPAAAMNAAGHLVIVWDGDPNRASDDDIHARVYDPNGASYGDPFVVNTLRDGAQQWPQVAINDANEFVIVWEHDAGDPNTASEIFSRWFDAGGIPAGEAFRLNLYMPGQQRHPVVAAAPDGSFLAAWESDDQDGSGYGIFARHEPAPAQDPNDADP